VIELTAHQRQRFEQLLAFAHGETGHEAAVLIGPAGTGKTTIVARLVRSLAATHRLAVCAPTHRAAAVLDAMLGPRAAIKVGTLHSLLGLRLIEREDAPARCEPEGEATIDQFDLVVCDEASMVDDELLAKSLSIARRGGTRILFVGDAAQLPPVQSTEISSVFRLACRIELSEIVRQALDSPIIGLATAIRGWIDAGHRPSAEDIAAAIPATPGPLRDVAVDAGNEHTVQRFAALTLAAGMTCRIVSFTNAAVLAHNAALHRAMHPDAPHLFAIGETVIAHREFSARPAGGGPLERVRNSAELVVEHVIVARHRDFPQVDALRLVLRTASDRLIECFVPVDEAAFSAEIEANRTWCRDAFERAKHLPKAEADLLTAERRRRTGESAARKLAFALVRHTYASTVHKCQGATVDVVIVDLHNLARIRSTAGFGRALYVAITRARKHVSIIAGPPLPPPPMLTIGGQSGALSPRGPASPANAGAWADAASVEGAS